MLGGNFQKLAGDTPIRNNCREERLALGAEKMKVRVVRNREGRVVCAVPLETTGLNEVLVEPELEDGDQSEDVEIAVAELLNTEALFQSMARA